MVIIYYSLLPTYYCYYCLSAVVLIVDDDDGVNNYCVFYLLTNWEVREIDDICFWWSGLRDAFCFDDYDIAAKSLEKLIQSLTKQIHFDKWKRKMTSVSKLFWLFVLQ